MLDEVLEKGKKISWSNILYAMSLYGYSYFDNYFNSRGMSNPIYRLREYHITSLYNYIYTSINCADRGSLPCILYEDKVYMINGEEFIIFDDVFINKFAKDSGLSGIVVDKKIIKILIDFIKISVLDEVRLDYNKLLDSKLYFKPKEGVISKDDLVEVNDDFKNYIKIKSDKKHYIMLSTAYDFSLAEVDDKTEIYYHFYIIFYNREMRKSLSVTMEVSDLWKLSIVDSENILHYKYFKDTFNEYTNYDERELFKTKEIWDINIIEKKNLDWYSAIILKNKNTNKSYMIYINDMSTIVLPDATDLNKELRKQYLEGELKLLDNNMYSEYSVMLNYIDNFFTRKFITEVFTNTELSNNTLFKKHKTLVLYPNEDMIIVTSGVDVVFSVPEKVILENKMYFYKKEDVYYLAKEAEVNFIKYSPYINIFNFKTGKYFDVVPLDDIGKKVKDNNIRKYINSYHGSSDKTLVKRDGKVVDLDTFKGVGIELEVENINDKNNLEYILGYIYESMEGNVCFERDGSLNKGVEIITKPMTYRQAWNVDWETILYTLEYIGGDSDNGNAGLHIHVSRTQFGDTKRERDNNISKLVYFFAKNWEDLKVFSRRESFVYCKPLTLNGSEYDHSLDYVVNKRDKERGAINLLPNATVEFRLPRGTLSPTIFRATLDFILTLCRNVNDISIDELTDNTKWLKGLQEVTKDYLKELNIFNGGF